MLFLIIFIIMFLLFLILTPAPVLSNYNYNFGVFPQDILFLVDYALNFTILLLLILFVYLMIIGQALYKLSLKSSQILYCIGILLLFAFVFFIAPVFLLLFNFISTVILLNLFFSAFFERWLSKKLSAFNLITYLDKIGILSFFFRVFCFVFISSSQMNFYFLLVSSHILSFCYVLFSRIYIYLAFVMFIKLSTSMSFLIFVCIFLSLIVFFSRLLINLSIAVVYATFAIKPSLWETFLLMEPHWDPHEVPKSSGQANIPPKHENRGWFPRFYSHTTNNYQIGSDIPRRVSHWKIYGFGVGVCTLGVGCVAAYYTWQNVVEVRKTNAIAMIALEESRKLTRETTIQTDVYLVENALMTKQEFCAKHPERCSPSVVASFSEQKSKASANAGKSV